MGESKATSNGTNEMRTGDLQQHDGTRRHWDKEKETRRRGKEKQGEKRGERRKETT